MSMTFGSGIAFASHQFNDVPDGNIFHDQIDFLASRNITLGCGGGNFCPNNSVSRQEMAAFLERMARALSPVVLNVVGATVTAGTNACLTEAYTPEFDQIATFTGGVYGFDEGDVYSRVQYRIDAGTWNDVDGAWYVPDTAAASGYASAPLVGYLPLEAGNSYEFSIDSAAVGDGGDNGCALTAIIQHQMPETAEGPVPAAVPLSGLQSLN